MAEAISAGSSRRSSEAGKAEIPIVNASLGTDPLLPAARKAEINSLFADVLHTYSNTLYVVAAGNEGNDNDQLPVYPCNTLLTTGEPDNLLCVGMTNRADLAGVLGQCRPDVGRPLRARHRDPLDGPRPPRRLSADGRHLDGDPDGRRGLPRC